MVMNSAPRSSTDSRLHRPALQAGTIVLLTLVVYVPAMRGGFVWNDHERGSLTGNIVLQENGLYRVWFTTESVNYWPVVWTSYWLEHQLWGLNPTGYHVVNVLIHAACAFLVWRILVRLNIPGAWLAALIFAVHPVNVESVAWITQRKNLLSLLFFLVAVLWYLRFDDCRRWAWYGAAVVAFLLAMLSKGAVVTLPVVLLLCVWWRRGAISRRDLLRSLPFFAVAVLMSGVEIWFQYARAIGEDVIRDDTFLQRLAGAGWVVWFYMYKALLPIRLCFIYPRWEIDLANWLTYLPDLALLLLFVLCWRYRRAWGRPILFALAYYVVTLGPVLGFVNIYFMRYSLVADHYQYVSIIAIIALIASAGRAALTWISRGRPWPGRAVAAAIVLALGLLTWRQSRAYENAETLWRDTLSKNRTAWMVHSNLGNILCARGELDGAIGHYREALHLTADNAEVHNNLGNALALAGKTDEAIPHYQQALQLKPDYADAHNNLGLALAMRGSLDEAIGYYRTALEIAPRYARAHVNLGNALANQHRYGEAIDHYQVALESEPNHAEAHANLANALSVRGRTDEAILHFREALRLRPEHAETHYKLGLVLTQTGRTDEALPHYRQAARFRPGWPLPLKKLGWILATRLDANVYQRQEAIRVAQRAVQLTKRQDPEALDALAAAYAAAGQFDRAVATAAEALALPAATASHGLADAIQERLKLYRQEKPYRERRPSPGEPGP
ncbi:MAG: tetratricopeptide repeat protein [Planctomycetes bacterium]|nr:tetratricopeptide repeat protein [Planctomycetota bacterium]